MGRRRVFTHYGGFARKHKDDPAYREFVDPFDARVAMTPDLVYPWFDGAFISHAVDTKFADYTWTDGFVVGLSPSIPARKKTDELLRAAVHGIPTMAHLSEQAFEGAARAGRKSAKPRSSISRGPLQQWRS